MKRNVVFMGEKMLGYNCLLHLYENPQVNLVAICTRKEEKVWWGKQLVREFAIEKGIPLLKRKEVLELENVDFIVSVLYPYIVEEDVIKKASIAAINLHQAPLPEYRGCNSTSHAIINGEDSFGGTLHMMEADLDTGDIIEKRTFAIDNTITARELYDKNDENCLAVFKDNIDAILRGDFKALPQDKSLKSYLYARDSMKDKRVSLDWSEDKIWNFVRGNEFPPFEPAYIETPQGKIYLTTKK